ncbi:tRNA1(Val) (adenine(37)-N6)-methyltransferase [Peptoniphilaceae bacterium SGI.131]
MSIENIDSFVNERIEKYNLSILQDPAHFKFGVDAVCLANFSSTYCKKKVARVLDLCSGTGIVGLIYSRLTGLENLLFVEKEEVSYKLNFYNIGQNNIGAQVLNMDMFKLRLDENREAFDYILINPPYMKTSRGLSTKTQRKNMAKIEDDENFLEKIFSLAFFLLKDKGELYMVNRTERLADILALCRKNKMEAKTLQFIRNRGAKKSSLVLLRFVKNANEFLQVLEDYEI